MRFERLEERLLNEFPLGQWDTSLALVDVGSMGGIGEEWLPIRHALSVVGFEPDEREHSKLRDVPDQIHLPWIVYSDSRPLELYLSRDHGKTSIYRPNFELLTRFPFLERWDIVGTRSFPAEAVVSLCDAADRLDLPGVDFLKLDTQGSELDILRGAGRLVDRELLGMRIEVSFLELYLGQPLFPEVQEFVTARGFHLVDLQRYYWKRRSYQHFRGKGQLVFADALYLRDVDSFARSLEQAHEPRARLVKFAVVCAVYGLHGYAVDVLQAGARALPALRPFCDRVQQVITGYDDFYYWEWMDEDDGIANR